MLSAFSSIFTTVKNTEPIIGNVIKFINIESKTVKKTKISELKLSNELPSFNQNKELIVI